MGRKWVVNNEYGYYYRIAFFIDAGVPSSMKSRIAEGAINWNIFTHLYFERQTSRDLRTDINVYWTELPWPFEGYCAATQVGGSGGQVTDATIRFDPTPCNNASTWYMGTGTPPTGTVDALTAAIHEFGHAVELYHAYDPYARHPEAAMWPYLPVSPVTHRYLATWDKDGVHYMYPPHS